MKKLPASPIPPERITLLAIDPHKDDCQTLLSILGDGDWNIRGASSLREATTLMNESVPDLILCERELPDGSWKDVFCMLAGRRRPPVVVVSRKADERLWAEVLNLGGFDMLLKPYDGAELRRMIHYACPSRFAAAD
ncbi:MAG TPA: response regulator [Bryobacteraceae bacterium]|nr:response regulator [Bryobacteraceae bacterium]